MTFVSVPITTFWDVLADAFGDPWFWYLTVAGVLVHSLTTRVLLGRWHRRYHSDCNRPIPRDAGHYPGYRSGDRGWR